MSAVVQVNGLRVVRARFVFPYVGVWFADLDLDPDLVASVPPAGPAAITIGLPPTATLSGMIDPLASGSFGATARLRVVGGLAGWARDVPAQHFPSPGTTQAVYAATAAIVGEAIVVAEPSPLPENYVRTAGPASRVLQDEPWWVDPVTATTFVGPRPPALPDPSLELMTWDPTTKCAELRCDTLVLPGTPVVDLRIGESPVILRDIEQTFDAGGSVVIGYASDNAVSRLRAALRMLVREYAKTGFLKVARYRFVQDAASSTVVALQAVDRDPITQLASPYPDLLPIMLWTGMAGVTAELPPSLEVLVGFVDGDPAQPMIVGYSTLAPPLKLTLDAVTEVDLGPGALAVKIAGGATPIVPAPWAQGAQTALTAFANTLSTITPPASLPQVVTAFATLLTAATTLLNALQALPAAATTKTSAT